jgi:hypothetical protein
MINFKQLQENDYMSKKLSLIKDVIDPKIKFTVTESGESSNPAILAKVKGVFFCPNGVSRNNRFYSRELWENVLAKEDVQERIKQKNMFGTIGHDTELNDDAFQKGLISHYMTEVKIDENGQGIGEAVIMNTPAGQILNTIMRAGSTVYVSSRGEGSFKGDKNGVPAVDENEYNLIGWDFVLNPGFLKANPKVAEALEDLENNISGEPKMDKLLEKLSNENAELKVKMDATLSENKELKTSVNAVSEENNHLKGQIIEVENNLKVSEGKRKSYRAKLAKYEEFSSSPESCKHLLEKFNTVLSKIGTPSQIVKALKVASLFKTKVDEMGTISEIKTALKAYGKLVEEGEEEVADSHASDLASKLGVDIETVKGMIAKGMSDEEIESMCKKVGESIRAKLPSKKKMIESKFKKTSKKEVIEEDNKEEKKEEISESRLERLGRLMS